MSEASDAVVLKEQLARIDRAQEETRKFSEESRKFAAEREKLSAEREKLYMEALKLERDRKLAPIFLLVAVMAGVGSFLGVLLTRAGH